MAGRVQWEAQVDSNVAKLLSETKELRDQLDGIKKGNYEIKLNIDNEKLEKIISNLDKMLNSLGKGSNDFKEFEKLSKLLNDIVSETKKINKAFAGINALGADNLLSSIKNVDKALSSLSNHITNINKDLGGIGDNTNGAKKISDAQKATEGLADATKDLANAQKNVENESNVSSGSFSSIKQEADALDAVAESAKSAADAKEKFADVNKDVKDNAEASAGALKRESNAIDPKLWEDNIKIIQDYMDANTQLNNLQASDKGTGKRSSEIALQKKQVEKLKNEALEARAALSSMVNPHEVPIDDWNKWLESIKQFEQAAKGSEQSIARLEDALRNMKNSQLDSMQSSIDGFQKKVDNYSLKENQSTDYIKAIENIKVSLKELQEQKMLLEQSPSAITENEIKKFHELEQTVQSNIDVLNKMPAARKGSTEASRWKEIDKISKYLEKNTKLSKEAREQLEDYIKVLKTGNPSTNVEEIHTAWTKVAEEERRAGREGKNFFSIFKERAIFNYASQLATYYLSLYDFIRYARQIIDNVRDIDTALTELRKVSDTTEQRLTQSFKNSAETAKELGSSVSDVISATADWSRMGYGIADAENLAKISTLYKNVGDGIEIDDANASLISTLQGFQLEASEAESIIDKFNEVANNFAIDSAGIGEALQRSAASFNAANTDLSKSIALITATNEVVQDPESVGTLWKTLSARIRGATTELSELGEETDEYTETTSKLRDLVMSLTGFDIMVDEDTFKDIYEIILGIGQEWKNLTDLEQASLGEALAGKRNANALYAVLGNLETLQDAYKTAEESAGSAMREQENYEKSIQYSIDRMKASAQEWSEALVSSGTIKWFVDLANAIVEVSTAITPLGTIGLGAGLFAGFKNVGINMLVAC